MHDVGDLVELGVFLCALRWWASLVFFQFGVEPNERVMIAENGDGLGFGGASGKHGAVMEMV